MLLSVSVYSELSLFELCWNSEECLSNSLKTSASVFGCSRGPPLVIWGAGTWWNQSDAVKSAEITTIPTTFPCSVTVVGGSVAQNMMLPWAEGGMVLKTSLNTVPVYSTFILGSKTPIKCESNVFEVLSTVFVFFFQFTLYRTKWCIWRCLTGYHHFGSFLFSVYMVFYIRTIF